MTIEEFDRHKEALKAQKLEKPKRLSSQYSIYMNEISLQQYHFDRSEKEVEILETITKSQVLDYYKVRLKKLKNSKINFHTDLIYYSTLLLPRHKRDSHCRFIFYQVQKI